MLLAELRTELLSQHKELRDLAVAVAVAADGARSEPAQLPELRAILIDLAARVLAHNAFEDRELHAVLRSIDAWGPIRDELVDERHESEHQAILAAVRGAGIQVFIVPHRRWEPGDYEGWVHPTPYQVESGRKQVFARGSWGGEWHPDFAPQPDDIVVKEHWGSSGFANTDLDFHLKQRRILHVIVIGMLANTCIECTGRFAAELGYHVTLVKDATAAFTEEMMYAAHELNGPTFAHAILTTSELVAALPRATTRLDPISNGAPGMSRSRA